MTSLITYILIAFILIWALRFFLLYITPYLHTGIEYIPSRKLEFIMEEGYIFIAHFDYIKGDEFTINITFFTNNKGDDFVYVAKKLDMTFFTFMLLQADTSDSNKENRRITLIRKGSKVSDFLLEYTTTFQEIKKIALEKKRSEKMSDEDFEQYLKKVTVVIKKKNYE